MKVCAIGLRGIPDVMGGIETHCEQLYSRLASLDAGIEIVVVGRSGYVRAGRYSNVEVVVLWAPHWKGLETLLHTPLAIIWARMFLHPDVIHLHAIGPGFFAPLARMLGFRVIATHHAADYERPKWGRVGRWFLKTGERMIARFANQVICVSSTLGESMATQYPSAKERFVTIRNGAPAVRLSRRPAGGLLDSLGLVAGKFILCVGRLDPTKGFQDVVRAFNAAELDGIKLVIVGGATAGDDYARDLEASASETVIFAGIRPAEDVRMLYENAALFVHPSYLEGFAMVVLEALTADVPILVSDISAHLEVGLDSVSYYAVGDIDGLAAQISDQNYGRLRCTRRATILKENDWETIAVRYQEVLVGQSASRAFPEVATFTS